MTNEFLTTLKNRRTYYSLGKDISVSSERVLEIAEQAALHTPSAFNSQSARAVALFGEHHDALWGITRETLRRIVPPEAFAKTDQKISSFAAAAGTVLYFEDMDTVRGLQESFPLYKDNFPIWSQQANGMLQSNIWNALESEGLGASLQHYNPLIDDEVKKRWALPESWMLIAQMPFGEITAPADEKDSIPASERVRMFR
ncbi:MAG: nitroreductase family protein [Clostridiales bacterium]|jgi:predicted oxidoreductase (fatty acid repression mutant protein)|nr:nitroreductase family protein [Clostridiales bacterium]